MTTARRKQLRLDVTPVYHCVTRCVRRSFLCGYDKLTRKNYDHRRAWIEQRLLLLAEIFCIEIAGYSIMSNHYHVVLNVNADDALALSDDQVIERWLKLYRGSELVQRYNNGEQLTNSEQKQLKATVEQYRDNLTNISRFMANLNEYIARKANKEDGCKGRFWEGRFESQALLDDTSVLRMICYVDLNPVRAGITDYPEHSDHTSIKRRITHGHDGLLQFKPERDSPGELIYPCLPISFENYLNLLDSSGRVFRSDKRGAIPDSSPPIFQRLALPEAQWLASMKLQTLPVQRAIGRKAQIIDYCAAVGKKWIWENPLLSSG